MTGDAMHVMGPFLGQGGGLIDVVRDIMPGTKHRFCARHMYANFKQKFPSLMMRIDFWSIVRAYKQFD
ncbi:MULE domain-containing protein [Cephalotus follicularis]|uniref:MULE domain-containing protein n=1 Tax=Cephalotus follicularis TaxID=3775 RepID=A0A1Q3BN65_CEPFO|nr:MULE domain-containing protein [Cephalotus follicularis]